MFKSKPFYYKLFGRYALFTDPVTKGGGEKQTYQIPTYQALKGITEQIYWKPSLVWIVDEVKLIKQIKTESKGIRTLTFAKKGDDQDRSYYTYLKDVVYYVKVHFEWNENRPELSNDWNEMKHQEIMKRSLKKGGRRDIFLGTRECSGYVEKLSKEDYDRGKSYYDGQGQVSFGIMFHSFIYPDESFDKKKNDYLMTNFQQISMDNGLISFKRPDSEEGAIYNIIRKYPQKEFTLGKTLKSVDRVWEEDYLKMGGE